MAGVREKPIDTRVPLPPQGGSVMTPRAQRATECPLVARNDLVVILPDEAAGASKGGILLPDVAKSKPARGRVAAFGHAVAGLALGDVVLYRKYQGADVEVGDVEWKILKDEDVLAVVRETGG